MLDWTRIDELRAEIGEEDFAEVAGVFLDELQDVMTQLGKDAPPAERAANLHFLKGCALNLGFAGLARLASDDPGSHTNAADLAEMYRASRDEFESRLRGGCAA